VDRRISPTKADLKKLGHGIENLLDEALAIAVRRGLAAEESKPVQNDLVKQMVKLLDEFASTSRYFNVDRLTGVRLADADEPLVKWDRLVNAELLRATIGSRRRKSRTFRLQRSGATGAASSWPMSPIAGAPSITSSRWPSRAIAQRRRAGMRCCTFSDRGVRLGLVRGLAGLDLAEPFRHFCCQSRRATLHRKNWMPGA